MKKLLYIIIALLAAVQLAFAAIDINTASEAELDKLPGVGPAKAKAIVEDRQKNGPFKSVDDVKRVKGIGDKTYEDLKGQISVGGKGAAAAHKAPAKLKLDEAPAPAPAGKPAAACADATKPAAAPVPAPAGAKPCDLGACRGQARRLVGGRACPRRRQAGRCAGGERGPARFRRRPERKAATPSRRTRSSRPAPDTQAPGSCLGACCFLRYGNAAADISV